MFYLYKNKVKIRDIELKFYSSERLSESEVRKYFKEELLQLTKEKINEDDLYDWLYEGLTSTTELKGILSPYDGLDLEISE
ncbi:MAG: hypothetical protein KJI71_01320 [Patescibacteria group bacterium]|nr:hypothetical protein [Patescibacteria group bacterium]